jgi:hypothetical protein
MLKRSSTGLRSWKVQPEGFADDSRQSVQGCLTGLKVQKMRHISKQLVFGKL